MTILDDVARDGFVLLRGLDVESDIDFEGVIAGSGGLHPLREILMSEPGRTVVDGTTFVLHTNALYKTGGTMRFGGFHTENYYVADVPRFIAFFCRRPSTFGGETGLVNTAAVYDALDDATKARLEARPFLTDAVPLERVAQRYDLSEDDVEAFCAQHGLTVAEKWLLVYKPSVIEHPVTGERAININFSSEIALLERNLVAAFADDFRGLQWMLHRRRWRREARKPPRWRRRPGPEEPRVGSVLDERIAPLMRKHYRAVRWRRGDVLLVDNLKMAHAGMPGFGPRLLRAMICNRVAIPCGRDQPGVCIAPRDDGAATLGAAISSIAAMSRVTSSSVV